MTKAESYLERIKKNDFMIRNKIVDHKRYMAAAEEIGVIVAAVGICDDDDGQNDQED